MVRNTKFAAIRILIAVQLLPTWILFLSGAVSGSSGLDPADTSVKDGLILAQIVHRHGARTPIYKFPTDPNANFDYGVKGAGQLTKEGKGLGFSLGKYLRSRYDGFLASEYSIDEVYVQASDYDRTIMTVQACLSGLFPPPNISEKTFNWQPFIPVHSLSSPCDQIINPFPNCLKLKRLYNESLVNLPFYKKLNEKNADFYKFLSEKSGLEVKSFVKVYEMWETLRVQHEHGLPLPAWVTGPENGGEFPGKMSEFGKLHFQKYTRSDEMKRLYSGALLNELIQNMKVMAGLEAHIPIDQREHRGAQGVHKAKMYIYSAHDTTISPLMDTLGFYDANNPPSYTSALMFELYNETRLMGLNSAGQEDESDFFVRVFYRRKDDGGVASPKYEDVVTQLEIPKCPDPCTLRALEAAYKQYLLDAVQRQEECKE